jgi:amino acid adenylation domain-containing protein
MHVEALVNDLNALGIFPFLDGGKLKTRSTGAIPEEVVARIRLHKEALIDHLARTPAAPPASAQTIPVQRRADARYPLSFPQRRLWFIDQLEGGSTQYNMPTALQLSGRVDADALSRALGEIVRRHQVLRTTYADDGGQPVQIVHPPAPFDLQRIDLRDVPGDARERALHERCSEAAGAPFDLARDPMLRACLIRVEEERSVLVITLHHIACDGWSKGVLTRELVALYQDMLHQDAEHGRAASLPELAVQYVDYAQWQASPAYAQRLEQQLDYWRRQLADLPAVHNLRTDRPRPAQQQFDGGLHLHTLDAAMLGRLEALARAHNATLFMALQAAFSLLIGRWSNERTVVVGTPTAGRLQAELEPMVGFFVNTLVLRTELEEGLSFRELLVRARTTALDAFAHQDIPFEMLVERLRPERSLSHSPLFQIAFVLQNNDYGVLQLPGLRVEGLALDGVVNRFDLEVSVGELGGEFAIGWNYATSLFDAATIEAMAASFVLLLEGIVRDPDADIHALPLVTEDDRARLARWQCAPETAPGADGAPLQPAFRRLRERNAGHAGLLHTLFEAQAARTPDAIALACEAQRLTYAELNRRANRVAHRLLALGVAPDARVAICVERSVEMVVGLLGVLKAGGAYVPLDPGYPADRLAYMLGDSAPVALLTQDALRGAIAEWLPADSGVPVLALDDDAAAWKGQPDINPDPQALGLTPAHLAYVIYTSGSTGRPKGTMNAHRGVASALLWAQAKFGPTAADRLLQKTSFSFDVSVWEFFLPLHAGATLVMARPGGHQDPDYLCEVVEREAISVIHFVPSMLQLFLEQAQAARCATLRYVLLSGEALPLALQHRLHAFLPQVGVHNLYGPTEAAVHVTHWHCTSADRDVPIGHPIADCRMYVLDARRQPVPVGVPGELYIGGDQVARGYLDRPELTAERFLPDPFVADPEARMYRTGDLSRFRRDGAIEYLGRNDFQVKIRGFRIELGEIEAGLHACEGVADAVVLAREDRPGDMRLVAYVVPKDGAEPTPASLREQLARGLAEHMLPALFLFLPALPVSANGKLDRRALPAPDPAALAQRSFEPPLGMLETRVAEVWQELLGVERVGRHDHFFELGGHSLLAMRLVNRVQQVLGLRPGVRSVFAQPTLAGFSALLAGLQRETLEPLVAVDRSRPLPLSHSQQRLWYIHQIENGSTQYHLPTALRLRGPLDIAALQAAFDRILARHEILRTGYGIIDGTPMQRVHPARPLVLGATDLRGADQAALATALRDEALRPFDLEAGPMIRVHLFALAADEHILLCTLHHIASDGWSMGVLTRELAALYRAGRQGEPDPLAPLAVQYGDYAVWQRAPAQLRELDHQLAYWTAALQDLPPLHSLPLDRPRPDAPDYAGGRHRQMLDATLTAAAVDFARENQATLFMCLQAALACVLMRWSNAREIAIGSPVAGRARGELDDSIGLYINTLVFRHRLPEDHGSFRDALARSRALALDAYAHQDAPFEMLVEALRPPRSRSASPLFQILFVLQNNAAAEFALDDVTIEGVAVDAVQTKVDLGLSVREIDGCLELDWTYARSLFDAATIARLAESYALFLRAAIDQPDRDLLQLPLTPADDLARMAQWNLTRRSYPQDRGVHELIAETALRAPEAVAVRDERRAIAYAELLATADAIARRLLAAGIRAGDCVAVCMDPSAELMAALLGVMRAGARYIPLELRNTPARMREILADAQARVVLDVRGLGEALADAHTQRLALDGCFDAGWGAPWRDQCLPAALPPGAGAYVIYTSGSTGTPKGVAVPHRGLTEYCTYALERYYAPHLDGSLVVTSHGFDITVPSLYLPLLAGGCVRLSAQDGILPRVAAELARDDAALLLRMTPNHVRGLCALLPEGFAGQARHVFVIGGERFSPTDARLLQARFPASTVYNHYGPSETVVGCCMHEVGPDPAGETLPIGRAMSNTCLYVLDAAGGQVPIGVPGELHIGGDCVSDGYVNRPELTAERFIANPFGPDWAPRLYRTGDLVRFDAEGRLVFLGRVDEQIKLRGFRIEPGEIETRMRAVDGVRGAVVVAAGEGDRQYLAAYLVPAEDCADDEAQSALVTRVQQALRVALPDYLNPAAYVCLERLPLSANGKLDRRALPPPRPLAIAPPTPPANDSEAALRALWAQVLALEPEQVDTVRGFFEQGGHSLLAIVLMEAVHRRFGVRLPVGSLYTAPTIREQAALLTAGAPVAADPLVVLQAGDGAVPLFLVHPVGGDVQCYRPLVQRLGLDGAVYGLQHEGLAGVAPVELRGVDALAGAYLARIRQVQPHGPYRLAGWSLGGVIALAMARRLEAEGETVAYLGLIDTVLDQDSAAWRELRERVADPHDLSAWLALLQADPDAARRFDAAHGLAGPAQDGGGATLARVREVVVACAVAARQFRFDGSVRHLHYYAAARTAAVVAPGAVAGVLACSRAPTQSRVFDADHFSLMRAPALDALAARMRDDLADPATMLRESDLERGAAVKAAPC